MALTDALRLPEGELMRKVTLICIALLSSFAITGLIGCGEEAEEAVEKEEPGPSIFNAIPKNGTNNVPSTAAMLVTFSKDIITPSSANLTFTPGVSGEVSYDQGTCTLLFKPSAALSDNTEYSMTIDGITDLEGNSMSPVTINFTTSVPDKKRPEVTFTFPEHGQKDIGHDARILIRFSEPMDRPMLRSGISFDPGVNLSSDEWILEWGVGDYEEVTIYPPLGIEPFEVNTEYTMRLLKGNVVDLSGNPMITDCRVKFRTLKYPVEKVASVSLPSTVVDPQWMYVVGRVGNKWVVAWGGTHPPGAPSQNTPSGTITASDDGQIVDDVEAIATRGGDAFTPTVSRGNGNRLTYQTANLDNQKVFRLIFSSTSSYLTFDLRSAAGTIPPEYVYIGNKLEHPSDTPFAMENE
jgi:hypothetical protein